MAVSQKRNKGFKLQMTEGTHARLVALSEALGQSPATVASFAVSEYVAKQTAAGAVAEKAITSMVEHMAPAFAEQLKLMGAE